MIRVVLLLAADFFPASAKVRRAEFHPVKSWLLISTDTGDSMNELRDERVAARYIQWISGDR